MGPSPTLGSPAQEFYTRRAPRTPCFEDQWGLLPGELEDCRKQILLLKFAPRISQSSRPRTGSNNLSQVRCTSWSWIFLEREETTGTHPEDINAGHCHFEELILPWEHWCCVSCILEYSLWLISPEIWYPSLASQLELPQDKPLVMWGRSSNPTGMTSTSGSLQRCSQLDHNPAHSWKGCHQTWNSWAPALPTIRPTLPPGSTDLQTATPRPGCTH